LNFLFDDVANTVRLRKLPADGRCFVGRSVVRDDDFVVGCSLVQERVDGHSSPSGSLYTGMMMLVFTRVHGRIDRLTS